MSTPQLTVVPPAGTDNWRLHAACAGEDADLFFPGAREPSVEAKKICDSCTVRVECLEYALAGNIQHGIWGGLSITRRREIRKQRFRAAKAAVPGAIRPVPGAVPCASRGLAAPSPQSGQATLRDAQHPR